VPAFVGEFYPYLPNLAAFALVDNSDAIDDSNAIRSQKPPAYLAYSAKKAGFVG
jgi:hypothetical protein